MRKMSKSRPGNVPDLFFPLSSYKVIRSALRNDPPLAGFFRGAKKSFERADEYCEGMSRARPLCFFAHPFSFRKSLALHFFFRGSALLCAERGSPEEMSGKILQKNGRI